MYYFAYGSNLDLNHFSKYIPKKYIKIIGIGYINNYIFKYRTLKNTSLKSGVANIEKRLNSKTYGIIYEISNNADLSKLDKKEGYISNSNEYNKYNKIIINTILLDNNKKYDCFCYIMNDKFKLEEKKPRLEYLQYLENGYKNHNLPKQFLKRIYYIFDK